MIEGQVVAGIRNTKFLRVTLTKKMTWDTHIANISKAANQLLGFVAQNHKHYPRALKEKAYTFYVCPKLHHSSSKWDPHQQKDISQSEMNQRIDADTRDPGILDTVKISHSRVNFNSGIYALLP